MAEQAMGHRLVLELDSLLKPGASSGTYCMALSALCGGRFCIAESRGVFLEGGL